MQSIPPDSNISSYQKDAYFSDCFTTNMQYDNQSALDVFLLMVKQTPAWVETLMSLRNSIVSKLGLKHLGSLSDIKRNTKAADYQLGDRVGIFILYSNSQNEVILEDRDKHLNVKISFYIEPNGNSAKIHASSIVHVNNRLGKLYMFFVKPVHKLIVPATLKKLPQA